MVFFFPLLTVSGLGALCVDKQSSNGAVSVRAIVGFGLINGFNMWINGFNMSIGYIRVVVFSGACVSLVNRRSVE